MTFFFFFFSFSRATQRVPLYPGFPFQSLSFQSLHVFPPLRLQFNHYGSSSRSVVEGGGNGDRREEGEGWKGDGGQWAIQNSSTHAFVGCP